MSKSLFVYALAGLALAGSGCATAGGGGGKVRGAQFPSAQEVERIEALPRPSAVFGSDLRQVEEWVLEAKPPPRIEMRRYVERSAVGEILEEVIEANGSRVLPIESLHCVASELARFDLTNGGRPDPSLQRFVTGACNAPVPDVTYRLLHGGVGDRETRESLIERWRADIVHTIEVALQSGGLSAIGIGFAMQEGEAALYVAMGRQIVEIEPVATRLGPGEVFELRGRALVPAETILASINRGRYGVSDCKPVGDLRPPAFHFACTPDPTDRSARVALSLLPPNRFLGMRGLDAIVWPRGGRESGYQRVRYARPRVVEDPMLFAEAFTEELNHVRNQGGMQPLALDAAQSETATRLAPQYFAAVMGGQDERVADLVALGLMAGWEVDGDIRLGNFTSAAIPETEDLAALLGSTLEDPVGRSTLLNARSSRLAVGPVREVSEGVPVLGAVMASYELFEDGTEQTDAEGLFERLTRERQQRERPAPYRLIEVWMNAAASARDVRYGERADRAMQDLLDRSATTPGQRVMGWWGETSLLDDFEFPDELLTASRVGTAIGVSRVKAPDEAWARYLVLIVSITH